MERKCFRCGREAVATIAEKIPVCRACLDVIDAVIMDAAAELGATAGRELHLMGWANEQPRPGETWLGMLDRLKSNRLLAR